MTEPSQWEVLSFRHTIYGKTASLIDAREALQFHFAVEDKEFDKLQMANDFRAVATPILIPLAEPEQR